MEPSSSPRPAHHTATAVWRTAVLLALAYLVFWQVAPRIRSEHLFTVIVGTLVSLVLVVYVTAAVARALLSWRAVAVVLVISAVTVVPLKLLYATGSLVPPWTWLLVVPGLSELGFVLFGAAIGTALSRLIKSLNMVPPAAVALALIDIWTVLLGGPVHQIMQSTTEQARRTAEAMTVRLPAPTSGASPIAVVGFADFLFIAFFVAAMCRLAGDEVGYRRTVAPMAIVLALYMLIVLLSGLSLPALVPLAVVIIARHWKQFRYERSELFALLYAGLVLVAALGLAVWLLRS